MKTGLFLASACTLGASTLAWTPQTSSTASSRRTFLDQAAKIVPLVVVASPAFADDEAPVATEASAEAAPAEPEPEPVAVPSDENEFIARLKRQSEANKDKYKAQAQSNDKLSKRQFMSQYDRPSYVGIHASDNEKVTMVLKSEFDALLAEGKVVQKYESKVSKKTGEISDDYAKPIWVYTN
mmetsp:Transcript_2768/g.6451  ORF Transcript_2768/g.6451 Transcript_2768/m.6451 type:complete len:182 (+) Transcript_2768:96-641(+)|eukprot:CAMPEP_0201126780 /NCGR_PEP_ID=MMETSP0850-20130426/27439_1 /ASSEMBLY_ACC=CAM_ASM_000622 /TAXON_ID=183588 /ORGANISM="Pseudo-nitzschia fraudulenta, Strain WWA7" /LENGTH=181 /DNA_ID=CAMNT_0047395355 /DNA_START=28 /DNA_END=573 /DNA_ORIENTATION=+